jgi:hypothetical protein
MAINSKDIVMKIETLSPYRLEMIVNESWFRHLDAQSTEVLNHVYPYFIEEYHRWNTKQPNVRLFFVERMTEITLQRLSEKSAITLPTTLETLYQAVDKQVKDDALLLLSNLKIRKMTLNEAPPFALFKKNKKIEESLEETVEEHTVEKLQGEDEPASASMKKTVSIRENLSELSFFSSSDESLNEKEKNTSKSSSNNYKQ